MKIIDEFELEKMISARNDCRFNRGEISDETLRKFLNYYDFINNNNLELMSQDGKSSVMYSKYYWFTKYRKRNDEIHGYNAGIEQEGFKLLEEIESELGEVDWTLIQKIENS